MGADSVEPEKREGLLAEYVALRAEILKRIEFRHQVTAGTLTAAAAFLGAGIISSIPSVAFLFTLLVPFLALTWVHNDMRVGDIASHIRKRIEHALPSMSWETSIQKRRELYSAGGWRRAVVSQTGVFVFVQLLGLGIGLLRFRHTAAEWALLGLSALAVVAVVVIMGSAAARPTNPREATSQEDLGRTMNTRRALKAVLPYLPTLAVAVIAVISLVFTISNTNRLAEVSLSQVAVDVRRGFTAEGPGSAQAKAFFAMRGRCSTQVPSGYSLWVLAQDTYGTYYAMPPMISVVDGAWEHDGIVLGSSGYWTVSVFLADANATNDLVSRGTRNDYRGFAALPGAMEAITAGEQVIVTQPAGGD